MANSFSSTIIVVALVIILSNNLYYFFFSCWLSHEKGLIYAFVAPALGIALVRQKHSFASLNNIFSLRAKLEKPCFSTHLNCVFSLLSTD